MAIEFPFERDTVEYTVILEPPYPPGWQVAPHRHPQLEINLVKSGSCTVQVDTANYHFQAGNVFFIPSGVIHNFAADPSSGVEFVVVQFPYLEERFIHQLINLPPLGQFALSELEISVFLGLCHQLQREIARALPLAEVQCYSLLHQIVVLLLRSPRLTSQHRITLRQKQVIEETIDFMCRHSHETIHIQEIARNKGLSPQYFRKLFKHYVGVSPKKYLITLKIQRSKCMLLHEEYSITDVAMQLGFNSAQQFAKVFRKEIGLTPSAWRKTHLLSDQVELRPLARQTKSPKSSFNAPEWVETRL